MRQNAFVQQLLYFSRGFARPLVSPVAEYVISKGHFSGRAITFPATDEIGRLANAMNDMERHLCEGAQERIRAARRENHMGIYGIAERVRLLAGRMELSTELPEWTTVYRIELRGRGGLTDESDDCG